MIDGIHESMLSFNGDKDLVVSSMPISWKNDKVNLCKKYPRPTGGEDDDMEDMPDQGSFFNFFQIAEDELDVSLSTFSALVRWNDTTGSLALISPLKYSSIAWHTSRERWM